MLYETYKLKAPDQDIRYLYFPRGRDYYSFLWKIILDSTVICKLIVVQANIRRSFEVYKSNTFGICDYV